MQAKDIMETAVISVHPDMPVKDVALILSKNDMTAVPVVDGENRILGIVSEADLIYRLAHPHLPAHIELLGSVIYLENPFEMKEEYKKLTAITARDIMTEKIYVVDDETDITDIATLMVEKNINGVPVVDFEQGNKLIGIVTKHDLIRAMSKYGAGNGNDSDG